ncbi:MAG: hypothetical protein IJX14_06315 [Clostridia bacterium]|nr:hypothetical protein [Clostridia bacterium]
MCDICGYRHCPAACPGNDDAMVECAVCGEDVYRYEVDEILDDERVICVDCARYGDMDRVQAVREAHTLPLIQQIRRWARV